MKTTPQDKSSYLKIAEAALKKKKWKEAMHAFKSVLEIDMTCAEAYLGGYLARNCTSTLEDLDATAVYSDDLDWQHMLEYADDKLKQRIQQMERKWEDDWKQCAARVAVARERNKIIRNLIASNKSGYIALKTDGSVICMLQNGTKAYLGWSNIISVAAGDNDRYGSIFVGIRDDGSIRIASVDFLRKITILHSEDIFPNPVKQLYIAKDHIVSMLPDGTLEARGDNEHGQCNVGEWHDSVSVAVGYGFTAAVSGDGTIHLAGKIHKREEVQSWKGITTLIAHGEELIGLDQYGRVLSNCPNTYAGNEFNLLNGIIDVTGSSCIDRHYLHADGTVFYLGYKSEKASADLRLSEIVAFSESDGLTSEFGIAIDREGRLHALKQIADGKCKKTICDSDDGIVDKLFDNIDCIEEEQFLQNKWMNSENWDIAYKRSKTAQAMIACTDSAIAAIKSDGTLFILVNEEMEFVWEQAKTWSRLIGISISNELIAGLRDDGKVLLLNSIGTLVEGEVDDWCDIIQIAVNGDHIAGLGRDGHVYTYCHYSQSRHNTCTWDRITSIYEADSHTIGLREDGTVLCADETSSQPILHDILDILDPCNPNAPICITKDHEILHANRFDIDIQSVVQYRHMGLSNLTYLYSDGRLYHCSHDNAISNEDDQDGYIAFATDESGRCCLAMTSSGHLEVWNLDLSDKQIMMLKECRLFNGCNIDCLEGERAALFNNAEIAMKNKQEESRQRRIAEAAKKEEIERLRQVAEYEESMTVLKSINKELEHENRLKSIRIAISFIASCITMIFIMKMGCSFTTALLPACVAAGMAYYIAGICLGLTTVQFRSGGFGDRLGQALMDYSDTCDYEPPKGSTFMSGVGLSDKQYVQVESGRYRYVIDKYGNEKRLTKIDNTWYDDDDRAYEELE